MPLCLEIARTDLFRRPISVSFSVCRKYIVGESSKRKENNIVSNWRSTTWTLLLYSTSKYIFINISSSTPTCFSAFSTVAAAVTCRRWQRNNLRLKSIRHCEHIFVCNSNQWWFKNKSNLFSSGMLRHDLFSSPRSRSSCKSLQCSRRCLSINVLHVRIEISRRALYNFIIDLCVKR